MEGVIILFQGSRGSGKTLSMTSLGTEFYNAGWPVYSNYSVSYAKKVSNDFIRKIDKNTELSNCVLLIDELQILFDSRLWKSSKAVDFSHFVQQIRKRNVVIIGTAQYTDTVEKRVRQHIDFLCCPRFYPDSQVCKVTVYDLTSLEDIDRFEPLSYEYFFHSPPVFNLYNTYEIIT